MIAGRRRTRFLNVLKTGFPAAPATLHGHAINCVPVHRFRMGRTPETGLTPAEWREFPRYALVRILMHAVKTEPARFWRVFGWFCCLFCRFPVRNALRASQAVLITDVMVNVKNISLDKKAFKKNNTATTNFDGPELCT